MSWWTRIGITLCVLLGCWLLMGCSVFEAEEGNATEEGDEASLDEEYEATPPVETLYNDAMDLLALGDYDDAVIAFERVEQEYPFSEWAKRAQVMAGYAAYRNGSFGEAAIILERFAKLHPSDPNTPYAYYLRALTFYDQIVDVGRDQRTTQQARQALREVVSRFPETEYARDAAIKLELTEDHLAGKEMEVGRYYLKRDEFLAAAGRFQHVIDQYQTTTHTPEALHRLVETYLQLGVKPEAQKYAAVLGYNYPGSEWYQYSYRLLQGDVNPQDAKRKGWLDQIMPEL